MKIQNMLSSCLMLIACHVGFAQSTWQSKFVKELNGKLTYFPDEMGNTIPDFSRVGYHQSEIEFPAVQVVKTIYAAAEGESQSVIQKAIDEVVAMPVNEQGFRGAILLKKGVYYVPGSITIPAGGIVIKGEGSDENGTVIIASGKGQRTLLKILGSKSSKEIKGTRVRISDTYIPVGSFTFLVEEAKKFQKGDLITILRPGTKKWIHDLKMDQIIEREGTKQWEAKGYDLRFERVITRIEENKIWINQPVVMAMEEDYGGGFIYKSTNERISENGVENILFKSAYTSETDEDHAWYAIEFKNCENGWVRNVTSKYFGNGCVSMSETSKYITVSDSKCLEAKSIITGGRRYSFNIGGQMCLVMNCETTDGRHDFVTGARVCGPNVFYNCKARNTQNDIGPHHRWAVGTLYDNITTDGVINVQDRGDYGTGHGWAGANQVLWNCKVKKASVQSPWVSAKNWCIGLTGEKYPGRFNDRPDGEWEGLNQPGLQPSSLYQAQLNSRKGNFDIREETVKVLRDEILVKADKALKQEPQTITTFVCSRSAGGKHDFYSEGDYWWPDPKNPEGPFIQRDGLTNPENFVAHRLTMIRLSQIIGSLASAYKITGDEKYVKSALIHLNAWFVDTTTRMNPSLLYAQAIKGRFTGRGIGIIDGIQLMEVAQGIIVMQKAACFGQKQHDAIKLWFADFLKWLTTHTYGKDEMNAQNNHGTCWAMQVASFARLTENNELLEFCRSRYKEVFLPKQMAENGSFPLELKRTKPYGYSIFNLDAMTMLCQILSDNKNDLWNYKTSDGKCIRNGIEYLFPYISDKSLWPFPKDVMYWENWPVAQPALIFGARAFSNTKWFETWKSLNHFPEVEEVIRNLPVRNPVIWLD